MQQYLRTHTIKYIGWYRWGC